MGRRPLTPEQIIARDLAKLGIDPGLLAGTPKGTTHEVSRSAEAVAEFYKRPEKFRQRQCDVCMGFFMVDYPAVARCSDACRKKYLLTIGIEWDASKTTEERWKPADVPLVIPPPALRLLIQAAKQQQSDVAVSQ